MLIVLNNKCNFEKEKFKIYLKELNRLNSINEIILCPSYIYLNNIKLKRIFLGSQDVSKNSNGPYTGEVSAKQLRSLNINYSIVGHSERRCNNKETNKDINLKIKELLKYNIVPILCVGETREERLNEVANKRIRNDLSECLEGIENKEKVIIAYEPVWSIGTGNVLNSEDIENIILNIKDMFPNNRIIYGGSVDENNIKSLNEINLIDGYLLGKISLYPKRLKKLLDILK